MFFLPRKTIRLIRRNQYDMIWYYLFKNLTDNWNSYLTVGAWLAVAFVVTVSQKEKSAEVFDKTELIAQRTFPSWSGQPPYSAKHNEICTQVVTYDAVWFCYLVSMFSVVVLQIRWLHPLLLFSCLAVSLHNHPAWKRRSQGWCFFYWAELNMVLKWWEGLQLIFLVLSSDKMPCSSATENMRHDLIEDCMTYSC